MQKLNSTPNPKLALPEPSADARHASLQLQELILTEISQSGGVIPFSRYMEMALYAPRLGYYSGGSAKLGADGDFTTAPEMSAIFGASLAQLAQTLFTQTAPDIMEFGAGSGKLAFDILSECQFSHIPIKRYFIVELSGELRARQEERLKDFPQVVWLSHMPDAFSGVVIGNEVLDAMPVELLIKAAGTWSRLGVAGQTDTQADAQVGATSSFSLISMQDSPKSIAHLVQQIPDAEQLPDGYISEVHPVADGFMRSVGAMLLAGQAQTGAAGISIWFDYGFPAHEYYLAQRDKGTLMCHYRHHAHPDPFYLPGLQDITAHVDFSAMARAGVESGLDLLAYTSQAGFLLETGLMEIASRISVEDSARYLPMSNALQKLISPAEMGELFKVLLLGCGIDLPDHLLRHDRCHRL